MASQGISVIIPTYGRVRLVSDLLQSIRRDAVDVDFPVEIILVDDSSPNEAELIQQCASAEGARVIEGPKGVGAKRNAGVLEAEHEIVLFLDSDVVVKPGLLQAHCDAFHQSRDSSRISGCLGKVVFVGRESFAWSVIREMQLTLPFSYPDIADHVPWGPTANLSFRRDDFLAAGGFDVSLPAFGGEDVDLGLRMTREGHVIATAPRAVAEHTVETWNNWRVNIARLFDYGRADYYLLERHPDRAFFDFPSALVLWLMQAGVLLALGLLRGGVFAAYGVIMLALSVLAYLAVYAFVRKDPTNSFGVHFLGPFVFLIMDAAKSLEALRHGRPSFIFCRLKFLDDLISQDWREICASAWGLTGSAVVFIAGIAALIAAA